MSRLRARFEALRERGERALIPFVTAGDPDLATTEAVFEAVVEAGADVVEIGVPFSDPIAEGPTIQRASERARNSSTELSPAESPTTAAWARANAARADAKSRASCSMWACAIWSAPRALSPPPRASAAAM